MVGVVSVGSYGSSDGVWLACQKKLTRLADMHIESVPLANNVVASIHISGQHRNFGYAKEGVCQVTVTIAGARCGRENWTARHFIHQKELTHPTQ